MKSLKFVLLGLALCVVSSPLCASHVGFCFNFGFLPFFQPYIQQRVIVAPPPPPPPCYYYSPRCETVVREYYRPASPVCPYCHPQQSEVIIHRHSHCCHCY